MDVKNSILIVDDDSSNLLELFHILRSSYDISTAKNGESALKRAAENVPDLILLDVIMPDMSGLDVIKELKKSDTTKSIPVILITGLSGESDISDGLEAGAVDYIRKPFSSDDVINSVKEQIEIINTKNSK